MKSNFFLILLFFCTTCFAQQYKVGCVGFYNLENLFDTEDDPSIRDEEYTPKGSKAWTAEMYNGKLDRMADVISQLGTELSPDGIALLGVAEIENRKVLEDLTQHEKLAKRKYEIVHYNSPDRRGIDVGLIYQPKYFKVTSSRAVPLMLYRGDSTRIFTRDILYVSGDFDGEPIHVLVNHWPSRRGGEQASRPLREAGAAVCKGIIDSLTQAHPDAKILLMGDLNDDPVNTSLKKVLKTERKKDKVKQGGLFNPMEDLFRKGYGSNAYRDAWSLFDQVVLSEGILSPDKGYNYYKTQIFNKDFMLQKTGRFKGYPFRTHAGGEYLGGYSDHFPVYVFLVKEI